MINDCFDIITVYGKYHAIRPNDFSDSNGGAEVPGEAQGSNSQDQMNAQQTIVSIDSSTPANHPSNDSESISESQTQDTDPNSTNYAHNSLNVSNPNDLMIDYDDMIHVIPTMTNAALHSGNNIGMTSRVGVRDDVKTKTMLDASPSHTGSDFTLSPSTPSRALLTSNTTSPSRIVPHSASKASQDFLEHLVTDGNLDTICHTTPALRRVKLNQPCINLPAIDETDEDMLSSSLMSSNIRSRSVARSVNKPRHKLSGLSSFHSFDDLCIASNSIHGISDLTSINQSTVPMIRNSSSSVLYDQDRDQDRDLGLDFDLNRDSVIKGRRRMQEVETEDGSVADLGMNIYDNITDSPRVHSPLLEESNCKSIPDLGSQSQAESVPVFGSSTTDSSEMDEDYDSSVLVQADGDVPKTSHNHSTRFTLDYEKIEQFAQNAIRKQLEVEICIPSVCKRLRYNLQAFYAAEEERMNHIISLLRSKSQESFGIPLHLVSCTGWMDVIKSFMMIRSFSLPYHRILAYLRTIKLITAVAHRDSKCENNGNSNKTSSDNDGGRGSGRVASLVVIGADDFLPILIYIIVHCNVHNLLALNAEMQALCGSNLRMSESGYYLTTLDAALKHILEFNV